MNTLTSSTTVLPWLADLTLLSTLWLGLLWLLPRCFPRLSAARKHLLLSAGLACLPVLMLGALRVPMWNIPLVVRATAKPEPVPAIPVDPFAPAPAWPAPGTSPSATDASFPPGWQDGLLLLWLAGMGVGLAAVFVTAWRLRHLRHSSAGVNDGRTPALWRQVCAEAGVVETRATLIENPACTVPMTWGIRLPVVLLPTAAAEWSEERLRLVLRHELAHVTRGDVLVALVTGLMALPLWFHPLVWLVWRDAHEAREAACDDTALARSGDAPDVFATQLLDAVTASARGPAWRLMPMALCMAARSAAALRRRLAAILEDGRPRGPWPRWQARGMVMTLVAAGLVISGLSACRKTGAAAMMETQHIIVSSKVLSVPLESKTGRILATAFEDAAAPGLQLRGVLNEEQAQELLRKLDEAKDEVRILSTPTVTTRNGQRAMVEIVRDLLYPTEFDPPVHAKANLFTPATPTAFESRPVGLRIDLQPQVVQDGVIELTTTPEITQFLGFVEYGSPIRSEVTGPDGKVTETLVTPNRIQQPVFHSMKTSTTVTMFDGQYLVIGGLAEHKGGGLNIEKPDPTKVAVLAEENVERLVYFIIQPRIKK
ncbi:MAG: M56 family metallopeptidase [Prosthecobacter sp.]